MLKTIFISVLLASSLVYGQTKNDLDRNQADTTRSVQRIASYIEYVAADYKEAVGPDGNILDQGEYAEQIGLLQDAKIQILDLPNSSLSKKQLLVELDSLQKAVSGKKNPAEIRMLARVLRNRLEQDFALRMEPSQHVSLEKAQPLYQEFCASCHGLTGKADTPMAQVLKPAPPSFFDDRRMAEISPSLAYHALTFGISGTGMAAFDHLSQSERWNLAFYVVGLRHAAFTANSSDLSALAQKTVSLSAPKMLANLSDAELTNELQRITKDPSEQKAMLAYLRGPVFQPPLQNASKKYFTKLQSLLDQLLQAVSQGQMKQAYELSAAAYLDEFEPYEGILRSKDPDLVSSMEGLFLELRQLTRQSPPSPEKIQQIVSSIRADLEKAENLLQEKQTSSSTTSHGNRSFWSLFAPVLGITLREGFEVMLLVSFLLAYLRKSGHAPKAYVVHLGWVVAMLAGFLTYVFTYLVLKQSFSGQKRELVEAVSTFVALAILLPLTHSILGAKGTRQWLGFLGKRLDSFSQSGQQKKQGLLGLFALFGIAFFAVYREMVETILFYRPYLQDGGWASQQALFLGVFVGALVIVVVALFISFTGKRLNPAPVMRISSFFLGGICISLAGQGIHALQEAGILAPYPMFVLGSKLPSIPWAGLYASWPGAALQCVVLAILVVPSVLSGRKQKQPPSST